MDQTANFLPYDQTGYFSKIVSDYLSQSPSLQPFYQHSPDIHGIKDAITARQKFDTPRTLLVDVLTQQYATIVTSEKVKQNIQLLAGKQTFTVTTAHQPNIFTGPLYFIYKILHTIKLADELNHQLPDYRFVPVYYMGSEDADLDELGFVTVGEQKLVWETKQTGAIGRMKVDKALLKLIDAIHGQVGVLPFGNELTDLLRQCYTEGKSIQQATLELTNNLFAEYGLVVLIPDNASLKNAFHSVVEKELTEGFSHKEVAVTIEQLGQHYKVQAGGREINLFYLLADKRERIEMQVLTVGQKQPKYEVRTLGLSFTKEEILEELLKYPERFSANVILRGAFQETVLPNIAFIGGGGELAYWLELKKVFEAVQIPYPVLLLRNSFLLLSSEQSAKLHSLGFSEADLFTDEFTLINSFVKRESHHQLNFSAEIKQAHDYYNHLRQVTDAVDKTLSQHVMALEKKSLKRLTELEKKLLRAERVKYDVQKNKITKLKRDLFPNNSLQERVANFSTYYSADGKAWLQMVYTVSSGLTKGFGVISIQ